MATSSITKDFVISDDKQVEIFINAIEKSMNSRFNYTPTSMKQIKDKNELRDFMKNMEQKEKEWNGKI